MVKERLVLCALIVVIFNDLRKESFSISPANTAANTMISTNMLSRSGFSNFNNTLNHSKPEVGMQYSKSLNYDSKHWTDVPLNNNDYVISGVIGIPVHYDGNKIELR